jgi:hypothetical protein
MYVDEAVAVAEFKIRMTTKSLVLKRASASRSSGQWSDDDYDVLEDGVVVGRISKEPAAPQGRQWGWASGHSADSTPPQVCRKLHRLAVSVRHDDTPICLAPPPGRYKTIQKDTKPPTHDIATKSRVRRRCTCQ